MLLITKEYDANRNPLTRPAKIFVPQFNPMKSSIIKLIALSLALSLSACVTYVEKNVFSAADFAPFVGKGNATITGQAFLKTRGGDVKFGAGNKVELIPVTPYTNERFQIRPGTMPSDRHPGLAQFVQTTIADGFGNFEFKNVKAGDYILTCTISWQVSAYQTTGAQAMQRVTAVDGEAVKVILTE